VITRNVPACLTCASLQRRHDSGLLTALQNFLIEDDCTNWWERCNTTLHIVPVVI
jgi:hypothetical protein